MSQKRRSKCLICHEDARRMSLMTPITKGFAYQLIRADCAHTEDERKTVVKEEAK